MLTVRIINQSPYPLPEYQTSLSAGLDIRAAHTMPVTLRPLERYLFPTGLYIELPAGYEAQIRPRSGLAWKRGLTVLNSPGTIDADYRGEIKIVLINLSSEEVVVEPGERIAQMVIGQFIPIAWQEVQTLSQTQRGTGGYGSTGTH
ncbi:MAG: dUTP diphosphatase [Cytophagales bacterium]|nr:dUTP diphosphatase [Cytophagales bacterium]MDW8385201.1 dUTP diphosphatase [Flammeovirgaceae bacterium]